MQRTLPCRKKNPKTNQVDTVGQIEFKGESDEKASLYFYGDITNSSWDICQAEDKCPQDIAEFLRDLDDYQELDIYINSGGGSVYGGLAIYNQLMRYQGKKTVYIDGLAASIASVIAMAGDTIIMPKCSQLMIHKPWVFTAGNADDLRSDAESLDRCEQLIIQAYSTKVKENVDTDDIAEKMRMETWLNADDAFEMFDVTIDESKMAMACASIYLDQYHNTPDEMKNNPEDKNRIDKLQAELDLLSL